MSLLRLGNKETVASLLASSLLFFLKLLTLMEGSCKVMRQPWGETHMSELGSRLHRPAITTSVIRNKIL